MKKLLILALLAMSSAAHAKLEDMYVGRAQSDGGPVVLIPILFTDERQCQEVGGNLAGILVKTEGRGMQYTCDPVLIDTQTLKNFLETHK